MSLKPSKMTLSLVLMSIAYAVGMLMLDNAPLTQLYSSSPYHRLQADALLSGHLWLADSIDAVELGLVWHDGHVQHVWGLGIGLWLVPFEALWRICGGQMFPDRIALGVAFALLGFYALRTGMEIIKQGHKVMGLGFLWLVLLSPPLWTLTRASTSVFEQTVLYAVILSLGILVSLVRIAWFDRGIDFVLCFALSSFAIWIRPTHFIYGLGAVAICSLLLIIKNGGLKWLILGNSCFLVSFGLLALTNYERFGSPTEFGHHMTVTTGNMVYMTRFGNPYKSATIVEAGRELAGLLFFEPKANNANTFGDEVCQWQAPETRWRRLDTTVFDFSYPLAVLFATLTAVFLLCRKFLRQGLAILNQPQERLFLSLAVLATVPLAGLAVFYLYYPAIASRYLFDFAPAMLSGLLLCWFFIARQFSIGLLFLACWLMFEIGTAKVPSPVQSAARNLQTLKTATFLPGAEYTAASLPATGISWNGNGWDADSGFAECIVMMAVDKPELVELKVEPRRAQNGQVPRPDEYRAMMDGVMLPRRQIVHGEDAITVLFDVPEAIRQQAKTQVLFLCFSSGYDETDRHSERMLHSVRWK